MLEFYGAINWKYIQRYVLYRILVGELFEYLYFAFHQFYIQQVVYTMDKLLMLCRISIQNHKLNTTYHFQNNPNYLLLVLNNYIKYQNKQLGLLK